MIQAETEASQDGIKLAWTLRWLLSSIVFVNLLADEEKRAMSVEKIVRKTADRDIVLKNDIWFGNKKHKMDSFTAISSDTLCQVYCC